MNGKTAPDQRTVPFMTTLQQAAGGTLPELMTLPELCVYLRVKRSYVYSLTSTDRIPHRKFGGVLRFVKWEIIAWIDRSRRGPRMSGPTESDS
jgi:excisionase family DNA binding protein